MNGMGMANVDNDVVSENTQWRLIRGNFFFFFFFLLFSFGGVEGGFVGVGRQVSDGDL